KSIRLTDTYDRWFAESLRVLAESGLVYSDGNGYFSASVEALKPEIIREKREKLKEMISDDADLRSHAKLLDITLPKIPDIITGKIQATEIIFPESSVDLVQGIYQQNRTADYFNEVVADVVAVYVQERIKQNSPGIKILEVGAGTGGTSKKVFSKISPYKNYIEEYCYTDISKAFLIYAENEFKEKNTYLTTRIFDIETEIGNQDIAACEYDIVIATNVLHAVKSIKHSLRNIKAALKSNGLILLNELSRKSLFNHLTFGLLKGWWGYEDVNLRIPGSPIIKALTWEKILQREGFDEVAFFADEHYDKGQQIIAAVSNGIVRQRTFVHYKNSENSCLGEHSVHLSPDPSCATGSKKTDSEAELHVSSNRQIEDFVQNALIECLAESVKIKKERIDLHGSFSDYGVDSITGMHFMQLIRKRFNIDLDNTAIFDFSSISKLTSYIAARYNDQIVTGTSSKLSRIAKVTPKTLKTQLSKSALHKKTTFEKKEVNKSSAQTNSKLSDSVAVIGISGRFAKSSTLDDLWENIANGKDLIEEISRWNLDDHNSNHSEDKDTFCKFGSFVDNIDQFDPMFFNISGMEAAHMDPQQRLYLEEAWKALEDSGNAGMEVDGCSCGVFVGCTTGDYQQLFGQSVPPQAFWGSAGSVIPARISYYLNLRGPAIAVDTACSSSLVAMHLACQSLRFNEIDLALAGGVFIQSTPSFYNYANRAGMLSATGRCRTFDNRADGFVPGEGVGVVVLKRLSEAIDDHDHIYGVIKGSGVNQDGSTNGLTAPSSISQEQLETDVYRKFAINPKNIQLVEAHGTGTMLGDPIEYGALTRSFQSYTDKNQFCAIGSIKTNLGHTVTAAGIAGVLKVLLALKHKKIPPSLHFENGNPNINFENSPFYVNTKLKDWSIDSNCNRTAAISSFGFSGTNAHVVIEEAPPAKTERVDKPYYLIVVSGRSLEQLQFLVSQLIRFCRKKPQTHCGDISKTLLSGRKHFNHRIAVVVSNIEELTASLSEWNKNNQSRSVSYSVVNEQNRHQQSLLNQYGNECIADCNKTDHPQEYFKYISVLADLFLNGYQLEFNGLFANSNYFNIPLPTYPFAKEHHWVFTSDSNLTKGSRSDSNQADWIHPLVKKNNSTFSNLRFSSAFTGKEFF
ncbi:MAG: methyltransferase, partial [Proteobacteria bacterium]|nr:methyltransferase [Pseudomonadota bacterium]